MSQPASAQAQSPVRVVASFSILSDLVRQVAGDGAVVKSLVGPNGDAHVYEPTPADAQELLAADLFVINGLGFEGWIPRLIKASGFKGEVVTVTKGIKLLPMTGEHHHGHEEEGVDHADPHAWHDVANGRIYVANITAALVRLAPEQATTFRANADRYDRQLAELDRWAASQLDAIPVAKRKVITSHGSFGYFSRAYGVTFLSLLGVSTNKEPAARDVANLVVQAKREGIKAIFVENMNDPRLVKQLAREAGIALGKTVYTDALSAPDGPVPTYEQLIRHNVTLFTQALTGG
ncbi:MAG: metal ABC transporter substrate-binding protein [Magnetococcus sp. YQC-5]